MLGKNLDYSIYHIVKKSHSIFLMILFIKKYLHKWLYIAYDIGTCLRVFNFILKSLLYIIVTFLLCFMQYVCHLFHDII